MIKGKKLLIVSSLLLGTAMFIHTNEPAIVLAETSNLAVVTNSAKTDDFDGTLNKVGTHGALVGGNALISKKSYIVKGNTNVTFAFSLRTYGGPSDNQKTLYMRLLDASKNSILSEKTLAPTSKNYSNYSTTLTLTEDTEVYFSIASHTDATTAKFAGIQSGSISYETLSEYTINYNVDETTVADREKDILTNSEGVILPDAVNEKEDYFDGWYTSPTFEEGTKVGNAGDKFVPQQATTDLYAHFIEYISLENITATYDAKTSLLSWNAVENATMYVLEISGQEKIELTETSYYVSLDNGTYNYTLTAKNDYPWYLSSSYNGTFTREAPVEELLSEKNTNSNMAFNFSKKTTEEAKEEALALLEDYNSSCSNDTTYKLNFINSVIESAEYNSNSTTNIWAKRDANDNSKLNIRLYKNATNGGSITLKTISPVQEIKIAHTGGDKLVVNNMTQSNSKDGVYTYTFDTPTSEIKIQSIGASDRIDITSISILHTVVIENYNIEKLVVRFGALISKELWDQLENVTSFGVYVATKENLDELGLSGENRLKAYLKENTQVSEKINKVESTNLADLAVVDENGKVAENGSYYMFNALVNIPTEHFNSQLTAVAYVKLNDQTIFLNERVSSAVEEAKYYLNNSSLSEDVMGALKYIASYENA